MGPDTVSLSERLQRALGSDCIEDWAAFVRLSSPTVRRAIIRVLGYTAGAQQLDDLSQEAYLRLCEDGCRALRGIAEQPDNQIRAYLATVAANAALDSVRRGSAKKRGAGELASGLAEDPGQPSEKYGGARWIHLQVLLRELSSAVDRGMTGSNGERDRTVFRMYFEDGFTAAAIAAVPEIGLSVKGVESTILRVVRALQQMLQQPTEARAKVKQQHLRSKG
jgi:RNA polymerase sigma factor (sigma-70 family)